MYTKRAWARSQLAGVLFCSGAALAQPGPVEKIVVAAGGHPQSAQEQTSAFAGQCDSRKFELHLDRHRGRVSFLLAGARQPLDVSSTAFGTTFLHSPVAGSFLFTCLGDSLRVNFWGVEFQESEKIRPVNYLFSIKFDGTIEEDRGLREEDPRSIRASLLFKPKVSVK